MKYGLSSGSAFVDGKRRAPATGFALPAELATRESKPQTEAHPSSQDLLLPRSVYFTGETAGNFSSPSGSLS
jgi:hypothetical protein